MRRSLPIAVLGALVFVLACSEVTDFIKDNTAEGSPLHDAATGIEALRKSFQELDPSEEHYIGRSVAAEILAMPAYAPSDDEALADYLNKVGNGVAMSSDAVRATFNGYRFAVLATDEVNAFATPGGTIFVTRGMIRRTKNEDELACILAHEIAHVTLRHGLAAIQQGNLLTAFKYLGRSAAGATLEGEELQQVTAAFDGSIQDIVGSLVKNGYSKDAEYAADELGAKLATDAGYDSGALRAFLSRLGGEGGQGGLFTTHPAPGDRLTHLTATPAPAADPKGLAVRDQRYAAVVK
jgi:predicted Zn-dependent protease